MALLFESSRFNSSVPSQKRSRRSPRIDRDIDSRLHQIIQRSMVLVSSRSCRHQKFLADLERTIGSCCTAATGCSLCFLISSATTMVEAKEWSSHRRFLFQTCFHRFRRSNRYAFPLLIFEFCFSSKLTPSMGSLCSINSTKNNECRSYRWLRSDRSIMSYTSTLPLCTSWLRGLRSSVLTSCPYLKMRSSPDFLSHDDIELLLSL